MGNQVQLKSYPVQGVAVRESSWDDCRIMAPLLRDADVLEAEAATGLSAAKALCYSYAMSDKVLTVEFEGKPCLMMGCNPSEFDKHVGWIWALGTDEIGKFGRLFLKESMYWLEYISEGYTLVKNYTHVDNLVHHKWLKHLGFTLSGPFHYGPKSELFYLIEKDFPKHVR